MDKSQWPTATKTVTATGPACQGGRPEQQAGELSRARETVPQGMQASPPAGTAGDSNEIVCGCATPQGGK